MRQHKQNFSWFVLNVVKIKALKDGSFFFFFFGIPSSELSPIPKTVAKKLARKKKQLVLNLKLQRTIKVIKNLFRNYFDVDA